MNRSERFYRIDLLLAERKVVSRQQLLDELEVSWATLKRDLQYLRDRFSAPIVFDREAGGYRFDQPSPGPKYELPGLWFSGEETHALLAMHQLLSELEPELLTPHIRPLLSRLEAIVGQDGASFASMAERIRLAPIGKRRKNPDHFGLVCKATLESRQLRALHYSRSEDRHSQRQLSPQRLTYYRNNWYLEAWCHEREALRRFSVDALKQVELLPDAAQIVPREQLEAAFAGAYGIYGGHPTQKALLRFSPAAARWVADEEWHPDQKGHFDAEGRYYLEVPYADATELKMDILRHGHHVEVLGPEELRSSVIEEAKALVVIYQSPTELG